jgi:hypothetical protein
LCSDAGEYYGWGWKFDEFDLHSNNNDQNQTVEELIGDSDDEHVGGSDNAGDYSDECQQRDLSSEDESEAFNVETASTVCYSSENCSVDSDATDSLP